MALTIVEANERHLNGWDLFNAKSCNGTIFHRRSFLSYHERRFAGIEHFLVALDGEVVVAQICLTIEETAEGRTGKSPYGASYGGFVFAEQPKFSQCKEIVLAFNDYLRGAEVRRFILTPPIACCMSAPLDTFIFVLLANGYRSINRDLSNVVDLKIAKPIERSISGRALGSVRKAKMKGVSTRRGNVDDFWSVMEKTFSKHGARPTHTKQELQQLIEMFPEDVYVSVAYSQDGAPLAGMGCFVINSRVNSSFYMCQDPDRRQDQGLSLLVFEALQQSQLEDFSFFDFGTSTLNMEPRENIIRFKEGFSRSALFRETFEWRNV
jgi:hypothetical protein